MNDLDEMWSTTLGYPERPQELMTWRMTLLVGMNIMVPRENLDKDTDIEKAKGSLRYSVGWAMGPVTPISVDSGVANKPEAPYTTKEWRNLPERLLAAGERLKMLRLRI